MMMLEKRKSQISWMLKNINTNFLRHLIFPIVRLWDSTDRNLLVINISVSIYMYMLINDQQSIESTINSRSYG